MNTKLFKYVIALVLAFMALPMLAQDWMNVYFKDGTNRKFHMKDVTEIITSQFDANGVQHSDYEYQHVNTLQKKYVYALNDVDSITFTKYNEEKVKENLSIAIPSIFTVLEDCEDLSDVEKNIQQINNTTGVKKAWSDGHQLFVTIDGWETMSFHFDHDEEEAKTRQAIKNEIGQIKESLPQITAALSPKGEQLKAAIINQQHYDERRRHYVDDYYLPLKKELEKCNIYTSYFDKPNLQVFSDSIFKYDLVFLVTHGGYVDNDGNKVHALLTAEELGAISKKYFWEWWKDSKEDKEDEFLNKLKVKRALYPGSTSTHIYGHWQEETRNGFQFWVYYPVITETFIEEYANGEFENANSFLYNIACESLKGTDYKTSEGAYYSDSLAKKFFNKGLGHYFGYNESNSLGNKAGPIMIEYLLNGNSVTKAMQELPSNYKIEYLHKKNVYLIPLHNPLIAEQGDLFLIQTHTNQVSNDVVISKYNDGKSVEVEGVTTALNPKGLSCGFIYDTSEELENPHFVTNVQPIQMSKMLENGNLLFRGTIPNLEPGQTYYYCAYTFDGLYYNYGDTCSFTTPNNLQIDFSSIELNISESKSINITSGNGDYTFRSNNETVATASLDGKTVIVKAINAGDATISVTDNKTGQTATIKVTVIPIPVDLKITIQSLELKVGEKLSFDITSGNGSYEIKSSNMEVAAASIDGELVKIETFSEGQTTITVTDLVTKQTAVVTVNVIVPGISICPDSKHPHMIDLGLPSGTKWACCNVGADKPETYGNYYSWGETEPKSWYGWDTYSHCDGKKGTCHDIGEEISGTQYDVAHVKWKGMWQMPTSIQIDELVKNCQHEMTVYNDVAGMMVTGPNGNKIFLPAAGFMSGKTLYHPGEYGLYKSGSRCGDDKEESWVLNADADSFVRFGIWNSTGHSVRPVISGK